MEVMDENGWTRKKMSKVQKVYRIIRPYCATKEEARYCAIKLVEIMK
jgi:propanediol dehydratase small subunit